MVSEYPNRKVYIGPIGEEVDVTDKAIKVHVEKIENGIDLCVITAENEDAISYLNTLNMNDVVILKGVKDEGTPISNTNWDSISPYFRGSIQVLAPIINIQGEICDVTAFGDGFQLKEMKVNKQYGLPSIGDTIGNVWEY